MLGWSGAEIAELLGSSVAAVNSSLQRARAAVDLRLPARSAFATRASERELVGRYLEAWERTDIDGLVALMRADAMLTMPPHPAVAGAPAVAAFLVRVRRAEQLTGTATWANGQPAIAIRERAENGDLRPHRLLVLDVGDGRITGLHAFGAARTLAAFGL